MALKDFDFLSFYNLEQRSGVDLKVLARDLHVLKVMSATIMKILIVHQDRDFAHVIATMLRDGRHEPTICYKNPGPKMVADHDLLVADESTVVSDLRCPLILIDAPQSPSPWIQSLPRNFSTQDLLACVRDARMVRLLRPELFAA